jgi:hypothetical protein
MAHGHIIVVSELWKAGGNRDGRSNVSMASRQCISAIPRIGIFTFEILFLDRADE